MTAMDKVIARTLLVAPSAGKWIAYQNHFRDFFAGRWPRFDELISFITDFSVRFGRFPNRDTYEFELTAANDQDLLEYVRATCDDDTVLIHQSDTEFVSALRAAKNYQYRADLQSCVAAFGETVNGRRTDVDALQQIVNRLLSQLHAAQQRAFGSDATTSSFLFGEHARGALVAHYQKIKDKRQKGEIYYTLPFEKLAEVHIKQGDLVFVGAYTSQGKSMLLRAIAYHFLTVYGLNVAFISLEMTHDAVETLFTLLHANNKQCFPHTPYVPVERFKEGTLDDAEEDFHFEFANRDLLSNPNYGTLWIEQPNKAGYSLADLAQRLAVVEQMTMPIHVLVIDYVTYMYPEPSSEFAPVRIDDYNHMIQDLKRLCLTYRDGQGKSAPLICLTAAQISRKGYEEAMKRDGLLDLQAFSTYTEIERSADIALTSLMTPEMRKLGQLKLQVLKNRDGVVPTEPLTLHIDFAHGFRVQELHQRTFEEMARGLRSLAL